MVFKVSRNLPMLAWIKWPVPVDYNFSLFTLFFSLMSVTLSKQSHDPPVENQWIGLNRDTEKCEAWIKRKREDRESISLFLSLCLSLSLSLSLCVSESAGLPQSGPSPALPSQWWHHQLPAGLDVLPTFQSVYDRSQMWVQEHTVPKLEINETWLLSKPHIPK